MAEQEERSMIGYDPLAWLHEDKMAEAPDPVAQKTATGVWDESAVAEQDTALEFTNTESPSTANNNLRDLDEKLSPPVEAESIQEEGNPQDLIETIDSENSATVDDGVPYVGLTAQAAQLILEASQTIQNVGELQEKLQHLLDIGNKIDIDASAVTQIDTATMQLLLVLKLTASSLQKEVNIDFPSDRFLEAAKLLGVAEMLSVDQVASGFF